MPANVVQTKRDEHLWARAKLQAEKQGRAKDYAYIMGIFQHMRGDKALPPGDLKKAEQQSLPGMGGDGGGKKGKKGASSGGPFIGPRGGKWADSKHTIPWEEGGTSAAATGGGKGKGKTSTGGGEKAPRRPAISDADKAKHVAAGKAHDEAMRHWSAAGYPEVAEAHRKAMSAHLNLKALGGQSTPGKAQRFTEAADALEMRTRKKMGINEQRAAYPDQGQIAHHETMATRHERASKMDYLTGMAKQGHADAAEAHRIAAKRHDESMRGNTSARVARAESGRAAKKTDDALAPHEWKSGPPERPGKGAAPIHHESHHFVSAGYHADQAAAARVKGDSAAADKHLQASHLHGDAFKAHREVMSAEEPTSEDRRRRDMLSDKAHEASAATRGEVGKSEDFDDVMTEFDLLEKAANGELIGRTKDGEPVYAARDELSKPPVNAPGIPSKGAAPKAPPIKKPPPPAMAPKKKAPKQSVAGGDKMTSADKKVASEDNEENGEGSHGFHRDRALAHLQAAQAHAGAAASAKKVAEAKDHKTAVAAAREASSAAMGTPAAAAGAPVQKSIRKNNLHVQLSAEDAIVKGLDDGVLVLGGQHAGMREDGRHRLAALRGQRLQKATIIQAEVDAHGSRGGDHREEVCRDNVLQSTATCDPAGNRGQGGLAQWFEDSWDPNQPWDVRAPVGAAPGSLADPGQDWRKNAPPTRIIDDDNPYLRAQRGTPPAEGQGALRMAYQTPTKDQRR